MAFGIRILPETLRTLAFGGIAAGYTAVGTAFTHPIRIIMITNTTDVGVIISWNGVNDHIALPAGGFILLDVMSNKANSINSSAFIAEGTIIYAKREAGAPASGNVYVSVFYALGDN